MNYYEHHLGDYLRDTAHLSMLEDGAYRRLLDAYYIRERALPVELREVWRLVRAQSKQDKEAVEVVLQEFFEKTSEGWIHKRCESEIERYRESQVDRESAKGNAKERQRRARERRRELFDALRDAGIVPAYDTPTNELHALLSRATSRPVTRDVTRDDTATQTPDTNISPSLRSGDRARATRLPPNWEPSDVDWGNACIALHATGAKRELEKFRDYWAAKAGAGGTKADWDATWRNWVRKAGEYAENRGTGERLSAVERVRRDSEEWARQRTGGDCVLVADGQPVRAQMGQPIRLVAGRTVDEGADDVGF